MYPATIFNWHDNSEINTQNPNQTADDNAPLFMQVFASDKGIEDFIEISGSDFNKMYGTMNFDKYGQAAIQAQAIIDAGGKLFAKRVVAPDSEIANVIVLATVSIDGSKAKITYSAETVTAKRNFDEVKTYALSLLDEDAMVYPLMVVTDNGRGKSNKAIRLTPDYTTSKTIGKVFYNLSIYEGTAITEQKTVTVDPTVVYSSEAYRFDKYTTVQVTGEVIPDVFEKMIKKISSINGSSVEELRTYDILNGYKFNGEAINNIVVDKTSCNLNADLGQALKSGSNGSFEDGSVLDNTAYKTALIAAFGGNGSDILAADDIIYDVDQFKIAAIVDANYPADVKNAIFRLVSFREDCVFFRDFGIGLKTFAEIKGAYDSYADYRNRYTADYCTSYLITDPISKKNVEVTMTYDLAICLVDHIKNNFNAPVAGTINNFILSNAIKGSINYVPIRTPDTNAKQAIDDIKVNYAIFEGDNCVVQSCYTSQKEYTQLSFVSNVLAIQYVLRRVRTMCPRQRYSLSTDGDLTSYATAVTDVLADFMSSFDVLRFTYTQDPLRAKQKIFYASIEFAFLNWAQTEVFDIYAINN